MDNTKYYVILNLIYIKCREGTYYFIKQPWWILSNSINKLCVCLTTTTIQEQKETESKCCCCLRSTRTVHGSGKATMVSVPSIDFLVGALPFSAVPALPALFDKV